MVEVVPPTRFWLKCGGYRKASSRGAYGHDPFWSIFEEHRPDSTATDITTALFILEIMSLYYLILWNQVAILQKHLKKDHVQLSICASGRGFTVWQLLIRKICLQQLHFHCHHIYQLSFELHQNCGSSSIHKGFAIKYGNHGNTVTDKLETRLAHLHFIVIISTWFDLNSMKTMKAVPPTFWQKMWLPWQRIVRQTRKACLAHLYFKMVMCANFQLNWMKTAEVFHSQDFAMDQPSARPEGNSYIILPYKLCLAGVYVRISYTPLSCFVTTLVSEADKKQQKQKCSRYFPRHVARYTWFSQQMLRKTLAMTRANLKLLPGAEHFCIRVRLVVNDGGAL